MAKEKPYRLNAGQVVFNSEGKVLTGDRIQYPGAFQYPQGGLDKGEDPKDAAVRELYEETSLKLEPVHEIEQWLTYDFPEDIPDHLKKYRGQKQKWFLFHWDGDPADLNLDIHEREFRSMKWMNISEVTRLIVPFKKPVYLELQRIIEPWIRSYLSG